MNQYLPALLWIILFGSSIIGITFVFATGPYIESDRDEDIINHLLPKE